MLPSGGFSRRKEVLERCKSAYAFRMKTVCYRKHYLHTFALSGSSCDSECVYLTLNDFIHPQLCYMIQE